MIEVDLPFEYTLAERDFIKVRFLERKKALGVGNPTLCYTMCKTVSAHRQNIRFPDGTALADPNGLTARDLSNFENDRMTRYDKLVIIDAYLRIVDQTPSQFDDEIAA